MALLFRFTLPLLLALGVVGYALSPLADHLVGRWFERDVELRSQLIFNTVRETVAVLAHDGKRQEIEALFRRVSEDERVLAMGLCVGDQLGAISGNWPTVIGCPAREPVRAEDPATSAPVYHSYRLPGGAALLSSFPLAVGAETPATVMILHDLSFIDRRGTDIQFFLAGLLAFVGVVAAGVTVLVARFTLRRWVRSVQEMLHPPALGKPSARSMPEMAPVAAEIRQLLRDLDVSRSTADGVRIDWSPDTLHRILDNDLPGAEVIVVSNREPYIHNQGPDGAITMQRPASGVVTALEPITRACAGTWIAHGSGSADRQTVDKHDHIAVPPDAPAYTLRRVWLSEEEENGYYYGLANEGLWPLCHVSFVRPILRDADWAQYVAVNRKFADTVIAEAKTDNPVVLVQDYHLALLPRMVRERLPNAIIITFWHIPWPNAELFSIFPWRKALLDGLLGSSIIGFHTRFHCSNFTETVDRFLECHIDREHATISVGGHASLVRPYPISIEWPPTQLEGQAPTPDCRTAVRARHGLKPDSMLAVGVERLDFTKGIPDRFAAVELFLDEHPEWVGRFTYLQVAAPSRGKLPAYQAIQEETTAMAKAINARFAARFPEAGQPPILLIARHHEPGEIFELFRAADVCVVSSLHDGMNLVAKEFVASRDDEAGVLVLSTFAGASRELLEALIVNPYDTKGMAQALNQAVHMPLEDQRERMALMRGMVRENNVFRWAGRMLLDAARLRKRNRIADLVGAVATEDDAP
jgi:trehalose 6-phosphate synthase/phosphatase